MSLMDSAKEKYQDLPLSKKVLLILFCGILPGACFYMEEGQLMSDDLDNAIITRSSAEIKFQKAREQKANLPKLEEKIAFTQGELVKASRQLPDEFKIDHLLQKTATIAQDVGVKLKLFDPGQNQPAGTIFKFVELPISVQIQGTYEQVASFFDKMVHLDRLVHVRDINLSLNTESEDENDPDKKENGTSPASSSESLNSHSKLNSKLQATAKLVVFRTLSANEESAIQSTATLPGPN